VHPQHDGRERGDREDRRGGERGERGERGGGKRGERGERHGGRRERSDADDGLASYAARFNSLEDVVGQLLSVAQDQNGCRYLQVRRTGGLRARAPRRGAGSQTAAVAGRARRCRRAPAPPRPARGSRLTPPRQYRAQRHAPGANGAPSRGLRRGLLTWRPPPPPSPRHRRPPASASSTRAARALWPSCSRSFWSTRRR
jgi:hypothetical protein